MDNNTTDALAQAQTGYEAAKAKMDTFVAHKVPVKHSVVAMGEMLDAAAALIDAQAARISELEAMLQKVTDVAVISLHDVFANSGRDGYNAWYFMSTMEAHEEIASVLGKDMWELLYDAQDRESAEQC